MELWIGTTNQGKMREFKHLFSETPFKLHSMQEIKSYRQPPETGKTFLENARIKAKSVKAMKPDTFAMAEDSGLVVEGLGGLPGIHSARYAGDHAGDLENTAKLLKMVQMRTSLKRQAKFVCTMVVYSPEGEEWVFEGTLEGEIAKAQKGSGGFGYDPIFIPTGHTQTLAEIDPGLKNQMSHRAAATKLFLAKLKEKGVF